MCNISAPIYHHATFFEWILSIFWLSRICRGEDESVGGVGGLRPRPPQIACSHDNSRGERFKAEVDTARRG